MDDAIALSHLACYLLVGLSLALANLPLRRLSAALLLASAAVTLYAGLTDPGTAAAGQPADGTRTLETTHTYAGYEGTSLEVSMVAFPTHTHVADAGLWPLPYAGFALLWCAVLLALGRRPTNSPWLLPLLFAWTALTTWIAMQFLAAPAAVVQPVGLDRFLWPAGLALCLIAARTTKGAARLLLTIGGGIMLARLPAALFSSYASAEHLGTGLDIHLVRDIVNPMNRELFEPRLEAGSGLRAGADFHLGYSPERIDPGNPTWRLENTPKVVSGVDEASLAAVKGFFDRLVDTTVPVSGTREAELTKLLENTFRHVNIALVNELAMFARDLGIDVWESIDAASTKPFGYMRFTPGPGVGGHCLPIDPSYLSWQVERSLGQTFRFVELANDVNEHMPDYVVRRVQAMLNDRRMAVNGSTVLVYGLAYKANTSDARETPSRPIIDQLQGLGATVRLVDPHVADAQLPDGVERRSGSVADLAAADLVVYLVDHDDHDTASIVASGVPVLDCRHALDGADVEHL